MRPSILYLFFFLFLISSSCKKEKETVDVCSVNAATSRIITNKAATIKLSGTEYYIVEEGSIDGKLRPCSLAEEFRINNLQVVISGEVKTTVPEQDQPCCTENFIITDISL